jgi:hypothetical protein
VDEGAAAPCPNIRAGIGPSTPVSMIASKYFDD